MVGWRDKLEIDRRVKIFGFDWLSCEANSFSQLLRLLVRNGGCMENNYSTSTHLIIVNLLVLLSAPRMVPKIKYDHAGVAELLRCWPFPRADYSDSGSLAQEREPFLLP